MALELGLKTLLLSQLSITTLVPIQTLSGTNYYGIFNENPVEDFKPPYILIHLIDDDANVCLDGTSGTATYDFDIDCYAYRFDKSVQIGKAVFDFLKDYAGPATAEHSIKAVIYEGKRHDKIYEDQGGDVRHHIESLSFQIHAT